MSVSKLVEVFLLCDLLYICKSKNYSVTLLDFNSLGLTRSLPGAEISSNLLSWENTFSIVRCIWLISVSLSWWGFTTWGKTGENTELKLRTNTSLISWGSDITRFSILRGPTGGLPFFLRRIYLWKSLGLLFWLQIKFVSISHCLLIEKFRYSKLIDE